MLSYVNLLNYFKNNKFIFLKLLVILFLIFDNLILNLRLSNKYTNPPNIPILKHKRFSLNKIIHFIIHNNFHKENLV